MDLARLDKQCSKGVLFLVLAILVFSPLATGAVRPQDFLIVQWLTLALIAVWAVRFAVNPKHRLFWAPVCWAILLFVAYAIGRYRTADLEYVARQELIHVLIYAVIFYAIVMNLHKQDSTQTVAFTLIILAALISMYAVYQYLTDSDRVWHFVRPASYANRGSGTFICPNSLAGYLEMILPLGLAYTLTGRFEHVTKVVIGYCSLVIFAGIAVTISRGGWMATTLTLMVLFWWLTRQRGFRVQAVLFLAAMVLVGGLVFWKAQLTHNRHDRLAEAIQVEDIRFRLWEPVISMWKDHFWWGVGPDHFDHRYRQYRPADDQLQARPLHAHNDYLNTLADYGLVGAFLVAAIWLIFFGGIFRSWKFVQRAPNDLSTKRSNKSSFVMGATLGLLAILLHSYVDFNMHVPSNALVAVTLMALVTGHFRFATERYWITLRWPLRSGVLLILLSAFIYLGIQTWQRTRECYWLVKAESQLENSPEQIEAYQMAFVAEPRNAEIAYELGEIFRVLSWDGGGDYRELAEKAMSWYEKGMALNPYDPYPPLRYGMCLHWLGRHNETLPFFKNARDLDPNNYYILANLGWHHVQLAEAATDLETKISEYDAAEILLFQSLRMRYMENPIALNYLRIVKDRLAALKQPTKRPGQ